jgi:hypothetical protein
MKRIILEKEKQTIDLAEVNNIAYPIVGACRKSSKEKAFVVMTEYKKSNAYKLMCVDGFELGNHHDGKEVSGTLENIFQHFGYDFFLFDTPKELFAWLAE